MSNIYWINFFIFILWGVFVCGLIIGDKLSMDNLSGLTVVCIFLLLVSYIGLKEKVVKQ